MRKQDLQRGIFLTPVNTSTRPSHYKYKILNSLVFLKNCLTSLPTPQVTSQGQSYIRTQGSSLPINCFRLSPQWSLLKVNLFDSDSVGETEPVETSGSNVYSFRFQTLSFQKDFCHQLMYILATPLF